MQEIQVKFRGSLGLEIISKLGGRHLGRSIQRDTYLAVKNPRRIWRLRDVAGENIIFAEKSHVVQNGLRHKDMSEKNIDRREANELIRKHKIWTTICKENELFSCGELTLSVDKVERLGDFFEIRGKELTPILLFIRQLKEMGVVKEEDMVSESYLDMVLKSRRSPSLERLVAFHNRLGEMIFGISSGTLTTLGLLTGMALATGSRLAGLASILVIAMADSLSDSCSIYFSKLGERGVKRGAALGYAMGTFVGKFIFPLLFSVPLCVKSIPFSIAVFIDIIFGLFLIGLLGAERELVAGGKPVWAAVKNVVLAATVISLSAAVGYFVPKIFV